VHPIEEVLPAIRWAAVKVAREWVSVVDEDDLAQEMSVQLFDYADRLVEMDQAARMAILIRAAHQIANQERTDYEYFTGNFRYSTTEVRRLLEAGALDGASYVVAEQPVSVPGDVFGGADAVHLFIETEREVSVEDIDVRCAIRHIKPNHQMTLINQYVRGIQAEDRKAVTRAIDALTVVMNRAFRRGRTDHNGPGSRKAMSNARAAVINKRQTER